MHEEDADPGSQARHENLYDVGRGGEDEVRVEEEAIERDAMPGLLEKHPPSV